MKTWDYFIAAVVAGNLWASVTDNWSLTSISSFCIAVIVYGIWYLGMRQEFNKGKE